VERTEIDKTEWDKIITPRKKLFDLSFNEIWCYRGLVFMLVKRDFITYYKQTILGPLWYLVQPICSTLMYLIVFGNFAKIGTDSIPQILFYFSGTMLWTFFSGNFVSVSNVFFENKGLFGKIYFPRLVVPISITVGKILKMGIQFLLFFCLYLYYLLKGMINLPSINIILFPVVIIWIAMISVGSGMIISSITTKYRDIALVFDFFISLLMYATPVVYPVSQVPGKLRTVLCLNPLSAPIELFRLAFFDMASIPIWSVVYSILMTILLLTVGLIVFNQNEQIFVDVI